MQTAALVFHTNSPLQGSPQDYATYLASRPPSFERAAIQILVELLEQDTTPAKAGFTVHIAHLADAGSLQTILVSCCWFMRHALMLHTMKHYFLFHPPSAMRHVPALSAALSLVLPAMGQAILHQAGHELRSGANKESRAVLGQPSQAEAQALAVLSQQAKPSCLTHSASISLTTFVGFPKASSCQNVPLRPASSCPSPLRVKVCPSPLRVKVPLPLSSRLCHTCCEGQHSESQCESQSLIHPPKALKCWG
jgi:hypothetical protein